jgi:hypothetical protein
LRRRLLLLLASADGGGLPAALLLLAEAGFAFATGRKKSLHFLSNKK